MLMLANHYATDKNEKLLQSLTIGVPVHNSSYRLCLYFELIILDTFKP